MKDQSVLDLLAGKAEVQSVCGSSFDGLGGILNFERRTVNRKTKTANTNFYEDIA